MSKKAGAVSADTRQSLLSAAQDEFYACGFAKSSLRHICSLAGVTTGALYFFFKNKDELFKEVINSVTQPFMSLISEHYKTEVSENEPEDESEQEDFLISSLLIGLYFKNQKAWDILLNHLTHPAVREFLDLFIDESTKHYVRRLALSGIKNIDEFAVHQYVHMQVDAMLTLISHDFTKEEMTEHAKTAIIMLRGAFMALISR